MPKKTLASCNPPVPQETSPWRPFAYTPIALAMIVGIMASQAHLPIFVWIGSTVAFACLSLQLYRKNLSHATWLTLCLTAACITASYVTTREQYITQNDIRSFVSSNSQLIKLRGQITTSPTLITSQRGAFGKFTYRPPTTLFKLSVKKIWLHKKWRKARGQLLAKILQADHRIQQGNLIETAGWLSTINKPANSGERNYQQVLAKRNIFGRISIPSSSNVHIIQTAAFDSWPTKIRKRISHLAWESLAIGFTPQQPALTLLEALLLGHRNTQIAPIDASFRRVGLAHLLSISGAHLGILVGLIWILARLFIVNPSRAAWVVLTILAIYLLAIPMRVPIIRAGIMASLLCIGYGTGRKLKGLELLALSCIIVLLWRPMDLFQAGFQLSFGIVASLLLFTKKTSEAIWPTPQVFTNDHTRQWFTRLLVDYLAANIVAFLTALPLVAYHFQMINPFAILLSLLAMPIVAIVLGLGYFKIITSLLIPDIGARLADLLAWITNALQDLVNHANNWPAATIYLSQAPSKWWVVGCLIVTAAFLAGQLQKRPVTLVALLVICVSWLVIPLQISQQKASNRSNNSLKLNMFSVGNGSCYLLQIPNGTGQTFNLMFDCGSQKYLDVGTRSIAPALATFKIKQLDLLMISHADLDHYCGTLDLLNQIPTHQIAFTPQFLAEAQNQPRGAPAFLIKQLKKMNQPIISLTRGWQKNIGQTRLKLLWPPPNLLTKRANDVSMVLQVDFAKKRILLSGDADQLALPMLLKAEPNLHADIADLPHHGSFVPASPIWIKRVRPKLILQSCGPSRLYFDPWKKLITQLNTPRLMTASNGMAEITITPVGKISWQTFR